jgi:hypothetical protein
MQSSVLKVRNSREFKAKPSEVQHLIEQALDILYSLGVPFENLTPRRLERMGLAFLAVADIKTKDNWRSAKDQNDDHSLSTREIITEINRSFHESISSGSYDDIRRKDLKLPVLAGIIIRSKPSSARNDPTRRYTLNPEYSQFIRSYGNLSWDQEIQSFMSTKRTLAEELSSSRTLHTIPVTIPSGRTLEFSPGEHNELIKAIIESFLPAYGYGAEVLYVGDTASKFLLLEADRLFELNFFEISHGELPDVIAYSKEKNWLYLIEAVHSFGPISPIRLLELKKLTAECTAEIIYVTAFRDRHSFRSFVKDIAWETEVWIAEAPDHLVHFNGDKFLGPY